MPKSDIYYGSGPVPKDKRRPTMIEAVQAKRVSYWGVNKVDNSLLDKSNVKKSNPITRNSLLKTIVTIDGKIKHYTLKIQFMKNPSQIDVDKIQKEIDKLQLERGKLKIKFDKLEGKTVDKTVDKTDDKKEIDKIMKSIKKDNNNQKIDKIMNNIRIDNLNKKIEPKPKIEPKRKVTDNKKYIYIK